ncbi:MAG: OmpA family protein, partial [Bdellovibrionales bacterium]|nr:OmpA family protein [Bdellovibrionales bacterium]
PELSQVDKDLMDITEENFDSGKHGAEASELQKRYFDLELKAVQTQQLSNARNMVETARDEGAKKYAKRTLEKAEQDLLTAERQIEASRGQPEAYKAAVESANNSARELLAITLASKDAKGKTPEEVALAARAKEKELSAQIAAKDVVAVEARERANVLAERNRTQGGMLATQNQELDAARSSNDKLSREHVQAAKLKEIESKFGKDEAEVYRQGENVVVRLKSMQFASARSDLPAASIATLAKVKSALEDLKAEKVVVEGHTDSVGSKSANQKISEQRAEAVSKYLSAQGQSPSTVHTVGYGFEKPLASNKTKEGRATNRRVDVIITPSTQSE